MEKKKNRKEYVKAEYLPSLLVEKLRETVFTDSRYYKATKNNFLLCVSVIYFHQVRNGIGINNYVSLGSKYWKTVFGGNYHDRVINPLIYEHDIIESHDFGYRSFPDTKANPKRGKQDGLIGIRYRINPSLLNGEFEHIDYVPTDGVRTSEERVFAEGKEFMIPEIPDKNFMVSIDRKKASDWVEASAQRICDDMLNRDFINALPDGLKIECKELINVSGQWSYNIIYRDVVGAKFIAETHGKSLFYFNGDFYISDIEEFLSQRIELLKYNYKQHISKIGKRAVEEKQNPKTLRLYSDLTSFPSRILPFININNKTVVQLDLRTSQFLLFANLLNTYLKYGEQGLLKSFQAAKTRIYLNKLAGILKQHQNLLPEVGVNINDSTSGQFSNSDVTMFIRDVFFADFYSVIQHELGFGDRLLAKHTMFKLLFKKTNRPDALLEMMRQRYPVVISIIAEFKKQQGNDRSDNKQKTKGDNYESNFSVFLSCIEAEIFVNNILHRLRESGIPCFTRHDSVVVAVGYEDKAETIVKQVFNEFGFRYNSREEDMFWEAVDNDELESSDFMQWLIDEDELNQEYYVDSDSKDPDKLNNEIMNEEHQEIINRLAEIGIRDDYCGYIDSELLEEIARLPFMYTKEINILLDEVNNQRDGMPFFQPETNALIRHTIFRFD